MDTHCKFKKIVRGITLSFIGLSLAACATVPAQHKFLSKEPIMSQSTKSQVALKQLTPPSQKVTVAVYGFQDKTGQFKPTEAGQTLSRAVTQGGEELLIKALQDAGNRSWFTIIERSNLNNLLKERQIITEMRQRYLGETTINAQALPPLLFAGVLFEGGILRLSRRSHVALKLPQRGNLPLAVNCCRVLQRPRRKTWWDKLS